MQPRPLNPDRDMPALATLLGRTRAAGGIWHPGGIQWWLRELAVPRDDFEAHVWPADSGPDLVAFVMRDGAFLIAESDGRPTRVELVEWATERQRELGATEALTSADEGSSLHGELSALGFAQKTTSLELVSDTDREPSRPTLPEGFRFASLEDVDDDRYIEGHRAAWSDKRPSPYRRELHDAVRRMPQFRADLVTIALAPDGTVASYCIGWMDEQSRTLEIEPLGTHRDYRRLGLATAVVREVTHRAWANGGQHVLVWNDPQTNGEAYGLYTGAGMAPRRRIAELAKQL
jgi:ribosomal protein S18 acetylase RimI-like enzyme